MPITGGNQTVMYIVLIAGLAAVAGGIWFIMRKKK
nr:LPXTG cell wall anchor domain-containing protein [uncultured Eubacterium sp.]